MKAKITALALVLFGITSLFCSCSENKRESSFYPYDLSKYVKVGDYMSIEYNEKTVFVSQNDVDNRIKSDLKKYGYTSKREKSTEVMVGDIANIDYAGYLNGVAFDGGTSSGYDLEIGSGSFIEGFESGLVGKRAGDKVDLNLTFPEDYHNEQMAGKSVVFKVTINKVYEIVYDEVTDENVSKISTVKKASEYRDHIYNLLVEEKTASVNNENYSQIVSAVIECSKIKKYPKKEVEEYKQNLISQNERVAESQGMTLERWLSYSGYTVKEFEEIMEKNAKKIVEKEMIFLAIADEQGIKITSREYKKNVQKYIEDKGFTSEAELLAAVGEDKFIGLLTVDKAVVYVQTALKEAQKQE